MNKMDHFVPHQYSEKRQNEQNQSFCSPPLFWKKTKWTKWIISSPTSISKRQNEDKMTKCHLVPPSSIAQEMMNEQNDQEANAEHDTKKNFWETLDVHNVESNPIWFNKLNLITILYTWIFF